MSPHSRLKRRKRASRSLLNCRNVPMPASFGMAERGRGVFGIAKGCRATRGWQSKWPGPAIAVAPAAASDCDFLSPFRATARWDAGNPALSYVEAWIAAPGAKSKPWTGGAERSEYSTAQWATPGMAFVLIDPVTQKALARTEIARIACPVR